MKIKSQEVKRTGEIILEPVQNSTRNMDSSPGSVRMQKQILKRFGLGISVVYFIYNCMLWKEKWDYLAEDALIEHQNLDPAAEPITDVMDVEKWSQPVACSGKKDTIAFLKTHKTGGSTMNSILNRFADIHDLDVALPKDDNRFNWPAPFVFTTVQLSRLNDKRANVLNNHMVMNRREIGKIMKPDYKLMTLLRNPVDQFYSMFHFLKLPNHYGLGNSTDPVEDFIKNPEMYHRFKKFDRAKPKKFYDENLIHNGNLYDLNFQQFKDKGSADRSLEQFIDYLEKAFHLILITEKYDESLLLLKKLMCWDFMDIVYHKKMVNEKLHTDSHEIKDRVGDAIMQWNHEDTALYKHFSTRLDKIIALQPQETFNKDLTQFRALNRHVLDYCNNGTKENYQLVLNHLNILDEKPSKEFIGRPECFCQKLKRGAKDYITFFAKKFPPYYYIRKLATPREMNGC